MTTALPALAAPPAAIPAASAPPGNAADSAEDTNAFARELQRAHDGRGRARPAAREAGTPADAAAPPTGTSPRRPAVADADLVAPADDAVPAAADETDDAPIALDVSALLAGLATPTVPRSPATPARDARATDAAADPLAATAARPGATADATEAVVPSPRADEGATETPRVAAADTAAAPSPSFMLPAALPAGAAGAQGGAALTAPPDASTPAAPAPMPESQIPAPVGSPGFGPALGAEVTLLVKHGVQEARLQLNPAEMGPITVQIQIDGDRAQVNIAAEQAPTRQALEQALPTLAGALRENGLTLTGGGVFEQPRPPRDGSPPPATGGRPAGSAGDEPTTPPAAARSAPVARGVVDLYA